MRILRFQLHDFGRHRDLDLQLNPGFTIIRGPNEAGKSTIQRGLELALFRKPTAATTELDGLRSWGIAADERSTARIEFVVDDENEDTGEHRSRQGSLDKEFRGQRGRVKLEFDGETITDPSRAEQIIADLTGIPNEPFFRSTASIRHQELEDLDRDEGALRDRLQASIGGGDKGSSRAKGRLEDAVRALKSKGDKNPGRLKIAEEAVARADGALRNGEAALQRLEQDRDALAQARDGRARAEANLAESRNMLESARQGERLRSDRSVVAERFERYRQAAEAQQRLADLESTPERSISNLRDSLDRMRTLQSRVSILQETLHEDRPQEVEPNDPEPAYLPMLIAAIVALGGGAFAISFGGMAGISPLLLIGALALLAGLGVGYMALDKRSAAMSVRHINDARERDRTLRRQSRVGTEEGLRVAQSGVANILRELGVRNNAEAEKLLTGEQSRRQEIATLQVQVSALLAGQDPKLAPELRDRAALELEQKSGALEALGPAASDARARERLEAEVRERQAGLERARDAVAAAMARVDANPVDSEQVAGEAERLVTWHDQLNALKRRVRIYETTLAAISAAEGMTMRKATRFLEQQVGRDIARLTGGRYRKVNIDDRSLDIEVWAPERGDWVPVTALSKGTIDQVFLAARIGLVRLVTQGKRPPLILDDPFVTFDDTRAARAALLLRELSSDFQVIYLACSNRYDGLADAVVELPGPTDAEVAAHAARAAATRAAAAAVGAAAEPGVPADGTPVAEPIDGAEAASAEAASAEAAALKPAVDPGVGAEGSDDGDHAAGSAIIDAAPAEPASAEHAPADDEDAGESLVQVSPTSLVWSEDGDHI